MNALFTPLDMTDYETRFVGYNELPAGAPFRDIHLLKPLIEEPHPMTHALPSIDLIEERPK